MRLDGGRQNLTAEKTIPLSGGQSFKVEFDRLFDIGDSLFKGVALRLASLQFGTQA
jgi:hypothetical protein